MALRKRSRLRYPQASCVIHWTFALVASERALVTFVRTASITPFQCRLIIRATLFGVNYFCRSRVASSWAAGSQALASRKRGDRIPKANRGYWTRKIARNKQRDQEHLAALHAHRWQALVIWECEVEHADTEQRLRTFLDAAHPPG